MISFPMCHLEQVMSQVREEGVWEGWEGCRREGGMKGMERVREGRGG